MRTGGRRDALTPLSGARPLSLIVHPTLDEAELHEGQRQDEREEDDRLRARQSELEVLERVEVDAVDQRSGRVDRSAAREQVDLREGLQDGDGVDDGEYEQSRRVHRKRDA